MLRLYGVAGVGKYQKSGIAKVLFEDDGVVACRESCVVPADSRYGRRPRLLQNIAFADRTDPQENSSLSC